MGLGGPLPFQGLKSLRLSPPTQRRNRLNLKIFSGWHDTNPRNEISPSQAAGTQQLAIFSCCVGNQSAQQARLLGLCRTNTALLLQTCSILNESLAWVGTLFIMLKLGVWDPGPRGSRPGPSGAWGVGQCGEVATFDNKISSTDCRDRVRTNTFHLSRSS